ncbi:MAG: NTP transferase domain-containing protein, partial [Gemmatimonadetes bacterium]|nr:NTP transferase domain-containing protein [Gemmatimonadota bacterium]
MDRVRPRGAGPGTGRDANRVERLRDRCGLPAGVGGGRAGGRVCAGLGVVAQCRLTLYHDCVTPPPLTLVILAAGRSTRFGRLKQLTPIGPGGEALLDYALYDGALAGFSRFLLVIQEDLQADFDAHLRPTATAGLDLRYAYQSLSHPGLIDTPPPGRTRPWGTGHAVLTAAEHIDGPFAMCNADDFYGRGAYAALTATMRDVAHLDGPPTADPSAPSPPPGSPAHPSAHTPT